MSTQQSTVQLPQGITAVTQNGLDAYRIETPLGSGLVYALGAHVAEWTPTGSEPVLWMSKASSFEVGKPIRGGIPLCFPWFGPGRTGDQAPAHGFARITEWTLVEAGVDDAGTARLAFQLRGDEVPDFQTADFTARLEVSMGQALDVTLSVTAGSQPFDYEEALHTYFCVSDARQVHVDGLDQSRYLDKLDGREKVQEGAVYFTTETDRVYFSSATTRITDQGQNRCITVEKSGSANTVVWNPWIAKAAAMADFPDAEWPDMCCVETVNCLTDSVFLQPGETHAMALHITVEDADIH